MAGAETESDSRRRDNRIVAAVLGVLVLGLLLPVLAHIPLYLRCQRQRAAARHVKALGGRCYWKADPPSWLFSRLAPILGKRFAKGRERLYAVSLGRTTFAHKVADADLAHLKGLTGLTHLHLPDTQVTDAGLVHLKGLTGLRFLLLNDTQVTDAGLVHLKDLTGLKWLLLSSTQVTDAGLANLKNLTRLRWLHLNSTQVTDAGLAHLKGLVELKVLLLNNTQVTDAGVAELRAALPGVRVTYPRRRGITR